MPATLSHRQPDLDMTSQLQENNYCNASLQSPACMRKKSQSGMCRGCHATAGMGQWQNRNGTGDAMPQQVWGRGCHATTGMGQGMPWHSRYGQGIPWHSRYGTGDAMPQQLWAGDAMPQQVWARDAMPQQVWDRGCHATAGMGSGCHSTAGMGRGRCPPPCLLLRRKRGCSCCCCCMLPPKLLVGGRGLYTSCLHAPPPALWVGCMLVGLVGAGWQAGSSMAAS